MHLCLIKNLQNSNSLLCYVPEPRNSHSIPVRRTSLSLAPADRACCADRDSDAAVPTRLIIGTYFVTDEIPDQVPPGRMGSEDCHVLRSRLYGNDPRFAAVPYDADGNPTGQRWGINERESN